jgi:hypothetical protein
MLEGLIFLIELFRVDISIHIRFRLFYQTT